MEAQALGANKKTRDGRHRRKMPDRVQVIFRLTAEKKQQLERLADGIGYDGRKRSFSEVMDLALDTLEAKFRGHARIESPRE